ncbi:DUF424 domain-containing protein [Methanospirillum hungatei]|jgi:hypothetical protein|uniref:DUF424 domain-containing protein n=1 Tax=Methanospirillum hungatei TaxID=2203 RepID=UPI0009C70CFF|nr:DUF424 domain-containing protein [Methanospirillum hungatei]MBP9007776.1 DUF424 domain-containing protein [Methanospirillum sp.]OQA53938.1 MAG: hypothetical protein BWY45_02795 [Euryarchaeota archaeon ADurb.Bin294]HOW04871.1 DUF424 domain-containing protein [Methanospirillum hungatei]
MLLRIHRSADDKEVIGLCDRELIGRTFSEGEISISINEAFFGNQPASEEEVIRVLMTGDNITIFGKRCVDLAVSHGILEPDSCRLISGIPYTTIIRI